MAQQGQQGVAGAGQPVGTTGPLRGQEPEIFDGSRNKSERWAEEFGTFRDINEEHELIVNPYKRVMLALSYMRGPNINDWKAAQRRALNVKVNRTQNPILRTDEQLWTDFETDFANAFTDTTRQQQAINTLLRLKMKQGDLDTYIAKFRHYAEQAGYDTNASATVNIFAQGLNPALASACLDRDTQPNTMDEWVNAARREQQKYANKKTFQMQQKNTWMLPTGWNQPKSNKAHAQHQARRNPDSEIIPMEIDSMKVTTEEEKKKHRKEGRCFECHKTGHVARNCPRRQNKENRPFKQRPVFKPKDTWRQRPQTYKTPFRRFENAKTAHIEEIDDEEEEDQYDDQAEENAYADLDISDLAIRTASFSDEQKEEWVKAMKDLGVDFQTA